MKSEVDCPEHYQINTVFSIWLLTHSSSHFREVSGPPLVILQASVAGSPTFTVTSPDFGTGSTSGLTAVGGNVVVVDVVVEVVVEGWLLHPSEKRTGNL